MMANSGLSDVEDEAAIGRAVSAIDAKASRSEFVDIIKGSKAMQRRDESPAFTCSPACVQLAA